VQRKNVSPSHNHCCHGNATLPSLGIVFNLGIYVTVSYIKPLSVATRIQQSVPFALLLSYRIFCIAVNYMKVFGLHVKCPILLFSDFNKISRFYKDFLKNP